MPIRVATAVSACGLRGKSVTWQAFHGVPSVAASSLTLSLSAATRGSSPERRVVFGNAETSQPTPACAIGLWLTADHGYLSCRVSGPGANQVNFPQRRMRCDSPANKLIESAKALCNQIGVPMIIFGVLERDAHHLAGRHLGKLATRGQVVSKSTLGDDNMNRGFRQRPDRARQTQKKNRNQSLQWGRPGKWEYGCLRAV